MGREAKLLPGERVLWTGTPVDRPFITRRDVLLPVAAFLALVLVVDLLGRKHSLGDKLGGVGLLVALVGGSVGVLVLRRQRRASMTGVRR